MKTQNGFSLVEVMIAAGILGALSLVMVRMISTQTKQQVRIETASEINSISNAVTQVLLNSDACGSTLGLGSSISDGKSLAGIKNRQGTTIYNKVNKYGNNKVKIKNIRLKDLVVSAGANNKYGELKIEIVFEKSSKLIKGVKEITKNFPVKVELDSSDKLVKCYSATENAIEAAKIEACKSIGGVFDGSTDSCNLKNFDPSATPSNFVAISTMSQKDFFAKRVEDTLDPRFVKKAGDSMSGSLDVTGNVEASQGICIDGNCRTTFDQQQCPVGKVLRSINKDGTVVCGNVTCPDPNTFYVGIDASGNPICKAFPTNTCSANQYVSKVNADGSVLCSQLPSPSNMNCFPGAIQRIDAAGNHSCVTTMPNDKNVYNKKCSTGYFVNGHTSTGNPICRKANAKTPTITTVTCSLKVNNQLKSSCVVKCPSGTYMVGGGCVSYEKHRFVKSTRPYGNGWYCETHEDYGSYMYNGTGKGYARCMKFQ